VTAAERALFAAFERRAARLEPALRSAVLSAVQELAKGMTVGGMERYLKNGDIEGLLDEFLSAPAVSRAFYQARKVARQGVVQAATAATEGTPALRRINIRFDDLDPRVLEAVRTIETGSFAYYQGQVGDALRQAAERGLAAGVGPRKVAQGLVDTLGLTPHQEGVIANFEDALRSGNYTKALGYELRQKAFDGALKRAREAGKPLTEGQIEQMTAGYRRRYKAFNAETQARTVALESQRIGGQLAWREAADELGPEYQVVKVWNATLDARTRDEHRIMNKSRAPLDVPYRNGDRWPGESSPWNCRCVETYQVIKGAGAVPEPTSANATVRPAVPRMRRAPAPGEAQKPPLESFITGNPSPPYSRLRAGVNLEGILAKEVAEIRDGLDAVLTPTGIKVDGISVEKMRGAAGQFTQVISRIETEPRFRTITFAKSHTNKSLDALVQGRVYAERQAQQIAIAERRLADPAYPAVLRAREQERLELLKIPSRWTVGSTSGRSTFSTAAHEAGHAILPPRTALNVEWTEAVRKVDRREWLRVSEYGASNADELWAEITTLRALGRAREVPSELLRIYETIYAKIGKTP